MENAKKFIITPITETITVGYKAEPVYTFDELTKDVQRQVVDDEIKQRQEDGVDNLPWLDENWESFEKVDEISHDIIHFFSSQGVQEELSWRGDYWTKDGKPIDANDVKEVAPDV